MTICDRLEFSNLYNASMKKEKEKEEEEEDRFILLSQCLNGRNALKLSKVTNTI